MYLFPDFHTLNFFIYLILAVLGVHCHPRPLECTGSVAAAPWLRCFSAYGIFPDQGIQPVSPELAGGFFITGPSRKPHVDCF